MLPVGTRPRRLPEPPAWNTRTGESGLTTVDTPPPQPLTSIDELPDVHFLRGRETSRLRATVDIAVTPRGVALLHPRPGRETVLTRKPLRGDATLTIAGRDRSDLIRDLERQAATVEGALLTITSGVPVLPAIWFPNGTRTGRVIAIGPALLFGRREAADWLCTPGPCDHELMTRIVGLLNETFVPVALAA